MENIMDYIQIKFNKNDFIELFLYNLIIRGINKIDIFKLQYDLVDYYYNDYYKELFMDMYLEEKNEGYFVELKECITTAYSEGFLSKQIKDTNERLIFLEDPNKIYSTEIKNKMSSLANEYILKMKKDKTLIKNVK